MKIIKTELDGKLVIGIVFENQDEIESVRAVCGGTNVYTAIGHSSTIHAPTDGATTFSKGITNLLNPLSVLLNK